MLGCLLIQVAHINNSDMWRKISLEFIHLLNGSKKANVKLVYRLQRHRLEEAVVNNL